jgi:hypothetical protein
VIAGLERRLYLDLNHDPRQTVFVVGSGRGGTTWLAELLARMVQGRLVFEPFHPERSPFRDVVRLFPSVDEELPAFEEVVGRVFAGRARGWQFDRPRPVRLATRRVVKDVHAMNTLPWMRARFPDTPAILVLRHPLAVAASRLRADTKTPDQPFYGLGAYLDEPRGAEDAARSPVAEWLPLYRQYAEHSDPVVRYVAEWCVENVNAVATAPDAGVPIVYYEQLVDEVGTALAPVAALVGARQWSLDRLDAGRSSYTDWFGRAAQAQGPGGRRELLVGWQRELSDVSVVHSLEVLAAFGLDAIYGADPLPLRNGEP